MQIPRLALLATLVFSLQGCDKASDSNSNKNPDPSKPPPSSEFDSSWLPTIVTRDVWKVNRIQASCEGILLLEGKSEVEEFGVCWSTRENPTIRDFRTLQTNASSNFELVMSGLEPGTTYHARAFATNSYGTAYGEDIEFRTDSALPPPTCTPEVNTTIINLEHQNYTSVSADTNGVSFGQFAIVGHGSTADMMAEFTKPPKTGLYQTIYPQDLDRWDTTHVVVHGVVSNATVTAKPGHVVSVVKNGADQYTVSFCQVPFDFNFSGISATFVTNGNLTTNH